MSQLISALLDVDTWVFNAINHGMSNPLFDAIMPAISTTKYWYPIYVLAILWLVIKGGNNGRWCALTLIVAVAVLDPLSTHLLKETIGRLRPYDVLTEVHQLINSGSGSFPSNHAMNNAAAAFILSHHYRRYSVLWYSIAGTIAFSRIYCGVHWPSDIVGGFVIGLVAGWLLVKAERHISVKRVRAQH